MTTAGGHRSQSNVRVPSGNRLRAIRRYGPERNSTSCINTRLAQMATLLTYWESCEIEGYESLRITVRVDGQNVAVSTFARDHEDAMYVWGTGREELLMLAARLSDLSWLSTSAWADSTPRPYDAVFHRLYIETLRSAAQSALPATVESFWPFATPPEGFGANLPPESAWPSTLTARCAILAADDARALGEPIARWAGMSYSRNMRVTSGSFQWTAGNGEVYLQLEPLLPHVMPTCDGVRRAA